MMEEEEQGPEVAEDAQPEGADDVADVAASERPIPEIVGSPIAPEEASSGLSLEDVLGKILTAFDAKLAYDATKEKQIDRLHDEVQQHRRDLLNQALRPFVSGVIRMHDNLAKQSTKLPAKPDDWFSRARFLGQIDGVREELEMLLEANGVERFEHPAAAFEPSVQTAMKRVPTSDPDAGGLVAERLRPGFQRGDTVLQKERVAVYVHQAIGEEG